MRNKGSLFILLLFLPFLGLQAQETSSDTLEHALLWRITKPGMEDTSYLFGTIHIIGKDDFFLPEGFEEAFAKSQKITFEINMEEMMSPFSLLAMMTNMNMKGDTTLKDLLSEEDYALLSKRLDEMGMPVAFMNTMKPMFVSMIVAQDEMAATPEDLTQDDSETTSYEIELFEMAQEQEKEIDGLETIKFQMQLFDKIPYTEQAKMLSEALHAEENPTDSSATEEAKEKLEKLVAAYKAQDVDQLAILVIEEDESLSNFADFLIYERNQNWIPAIQKMTAEGPVLFAVGSGHLGGEKGVIRLLRKAGFVVEPVGL